MRRILTCLSLNQLCAKCSEVVSGQLSLLQSRKRKTLENPTQQKSNPGPGCTNVTKIYFKLDL